MATRHIPSAIKRWIAAYFADSTNGPAAIIAAGGVIGPASATDNHLAVFDGITGKLIKDGGVIPSPGITNSAPADTIIKSNGANAVASRITDVVSTSLLLDTSATVDPIILRAKDQDGIPFDITIGGDPPLTFGVFAQFPIGLNADYFSGGDPLIGDLSLASLTTGGTITAGGRIAPATAGGADLGSPDKPFVQLTLGNSDTTNVQILGTFTSTRIATLPDLSGTVAMQSIVTNSTPTTGQTVSASTGKLDETLYITPAGTLLALTVSLPTSANSRVGQIIRGFISQIITGLTVNVSGSGTVIGATPITSAVNSTFAYQCVSVAGNGTWIRIQ